MHGMRLQIVPVPDDETMPAGHALSHEISVEVEIECGESDDATHTMPDGTVMPGESHEGAPALPADLVPGEDWAGEISRFH
jgi:hypothetical protein